MLRRSAILLCTDFDETITLRDTISLLFQLASCTASTQQQLETQYANELKDFLRCYNAKFLSSSTRTFDNAGLPEFLEGYVATDLRSLKRVVKCRALKGIHHEDIVKAANTVQIQPHCADTLAAVDEWKVISTNWSKHFITSVLTQRGIFAEGRQVIANELKVDNSGVTTGEIDIQVQSPMDKARWINKMRAMYVEMRPTLVYVGDSANDLLALLEADVGVWFISDSNSPSSQLLGQLLVNYGIDYQPLMTYKSLDDCAAASSDDSDGRRVIFTITEWAQLKSLVGERLQN